VQHHISVLEKNNLVTKAGEKYGVLYFISDYLQHNLAAYDEIKNKIFKRVIVPDLDQIWIKVNKAYSNLKNMNVLMEVSAAVSLTNVALLMALLLYM
jgi:hypothetical protein